MEYINMYKKWLNFDEDTKNELQGLGEDEIKDRFHTDLEFGTGGLRGVIAAGTNRINVYTIRRATKGLSNYILKQNIKNPSVAIAFDSRRKSEVFAREAALVLNANNIKTYIYSELEPTPMLSFAVRKLNAVAGIVLTASHNPKEYNGYKVYWSDGGQITEEHAKGILDEIKLVDYDEIEALDFNSAVSKGLYNNISQDIIDDYIERVKKLSINRKAINLGGDKIKIIYTPLHGTGNKPVRRVLSELGFTKVSVVKEQELPDAEFPTVKFPNPEEHEAFTLAIKMAKEKGSDLIIGTDPDCDRIGVVVKNNKGDYLVLTGNQTGALLTYYMLSQMKENESLPKNPVIIKTIVTTELSRKICEDFDVEIMDVLTGFKYIGEKIKEFEVNENKNFVLGFEESYGYLAGTFVRDKDAVIAAALICEMASYYKLQNKTLYDALMGIYERYGYFKEDLKSVTLNGIEGSEKIKKIMNDLRNNPPLDISGRKVIRIKDYKEKIDKDILSNQVYGINLPASNVIQLILDDESIITVRPSGTEPKIKFYFAAKGDTMDKASEKIKIMQDGIMYLL